MYALATGRDGRTYLSWLEPVGGRTHALRFSRFDGGGWSAPIEIARGDDWFVNWADHPSLTAGADGTLFAHWLVNTSGGEGGYGYAIRGAASRDGGRTWRTVFDEGARNVKDYSGFLTYLPGAASVDAVYLTPLSPDDGSGPAHDHIKTLGVARFAADGALQSRQIVDGDVCSCCNTDMAETAAGPIAVYRDHDAGEIRDISIVRLVDGKWTAPAPVARDGWRIGGCPTNGPAAAAAGNRAAVAWFTAAGDSPRVQVAFSSDAGASFSAPDAGRRRPAGGLDRRPAARRRAGAGELARAHRRGHRRGAAAGRRRRRPHRPDRGRVRDERPHHRHPDDRPRRRRGARRLARRPREDRARAAVGAHDLEPLSELSPCLSRRHSEVSQRLPSTQWQPRGARHRVIRFLRYLP